jgi:signal transduction histidine kinase
MWYIQACRVCGAANAIKQSIDDSSENVKECRITTETNGVQDSLDLRVSATPINIDGEDLVVLSLTDISNEKRRQVLENIFFHDVINIAGGLKGVIDFLLEQEEVVEEKKELIAMAGVSVNSLMDEILSHRALKAAESGELNVVFETAESIDVLTHVKYVLSRHAVAREKEIVVDENSDNVEFLTDVVILKRVLVNLAKNALEASSQGEQVLMWCKKDEKNISFHVKNNSVMSNEVFLQIFQRSFSTKGSNRGLGTYSVKLLTERYLGGKVGFVSSEETGTIFTITFPLAN